MFLLAIAGISRQAIAAGKPAAENPAKIHTIRVATYNTSLFRDTDGELIRDLETGTNEQAKKIAEVIQRVRPDVMLCNEFDYDEDGRAAKLFQEKYLAVGQNGLEPIHFVDHYVGPVNTGRPSGIDLDNNGRTDDPQRRLRLRHPRRPIRHARPVAVPDRKAIRPHVPRLSSGATCRTHCLPVDPKTNKPYYSDAAVAILRLSSKSFWDVPVEIPASAASPAWTLHLLCSHPTPPVFDGPEDRNGHRNHDEIRLLADYISPDRAELSGRRRGQTRRTRIRMSSS